MNRIFNRYKSPRVLYDENYARSYYLQDQDGQLTQSTKNIAEWILSILRLTSKPIHLLDLGCGSGRYVPFYDNLASYTGLDYSKSMLQYCKNQVFLSHPKVDAEFIQCDLNQPPALRRQYDVIISVGVFAEHVPLSRRAFRYMSSHLADGGILILSGVHSGSPTALYSLGRRLVNQLLLASYIPLPLFIRDLLLSHSCHTDEVHMLQALSYGLTLLKLENFFTDHHLHLFAAFSKSPLEAYNSADISQVSS